MSLVVNKYSRAVLACCLASVLVIFSGCSSDKTEEESKESAMPLERQQWLGSWHVKDCQEGCNDIFGIPQKSLSFTDEKEEAILQFEKNHRTAYSNGGNQETIQGQWSTQGDILTLYNAFGLDYTLVGGYNFLGNGDGLSFLAEYKANLKEAKKINDISSLSSMIASENHLIEYVPVGYGVGKGRFVGKSSKALSLDELETKSNEYDVYLIPVEKVRYSFTLQRYDREVKVNVPKNHLQNSKVFFSGCDP